MNNQPKLIELQSPVLLIQYLTFLLFGNQGVN